MGRVLITVTGNGSSVTATQCSSRGCRPLPTVVRASVHALPQVLSEAIPRAAEHLGLAPLPTDGQGRLPLSDPAACESFVALVEALCQHLHVAGFRRDTLRAFLKADSRPGVRPSRRLWPAGDLLRPRLTTLTATIITLGNGLVALVAFATGLSVAQLHQPDNVLRHWEAYPSMPQHLLEGGSDSDDSSSLGDEAEDDGQASGLA